MYPDKGNFIGFVANLQSAPLLRNTTQSFQKHTDFPCQQAALPELLQGVGWSDHWSYWQMGYQGLMVTDTAPFRYPHYHQDTDTIDKIDFDRLAIVVQALVEVVKDLSAE